MGVGPDDVGVDEGGAFAGTNPIGRGLHGAERSQKVGAVDLLAEEAGEAGDQFGDLAAGGLAFDGDGDGVAVILDQIEEREALEAGDIERLPEFALAGGAIAGSDEGDFGGVRVEIAGGFGASGGLDKLGAGGRGAAHDVELAMTPVGGHLTAGGSGIGRGADGLLEHFVGRDAEGEAEGAIAIVEIEPIVAGTQGHAGCDLDGLMPCPADLKEDAVLALEGDFAVVEAARGVHQAKGADELFGVESCEAGRHGRRLGRRLSHHGAAPSL